MRSETAFAAALSFLALAPAQPPLAAAAGPSSKRVKGLEVISLRGLPEGLALAVRLRNVRKEPLKTNVVFQAVEGGKNCEEAATLAPGEERLFQCFQGTIAPDAVYRVKVTVSAQSGPPLEELENSVAFTREDLVPYQRALHEPTRAEEGIVDQEGSAEAGQVLAARFAKLRALAVLPSKGRVAVPIEKATAPRLRFVSGESYVAWLKLPEYAGPYQITVNSVVDRLGLKVFVPRVILHDGRGRLTRSFGEGSFPLPKSTTGEGRVDELRREAADLPEPTPAPDVQQLVGRITVAEENRDERYMVIFTDGSAVGRPVFTLAGRMTLVGEGEFRVEIGDKDVKQRTFTRSATGQLAVVIRPSRE